MKLSRKWALLAAFLLKGFFKCPYIPSMPGKEWSLGASRQPKLDVKGKLFLSRDRRKGDLYWNVWNKSDLCASVGNRHSGSPNRWRSRRKSKAFHEGRAQPWCNFPSGPWTAFALTGLSSPLFQKYRRREDLPFLSGAGALGVTVPRSFSPLSSEPEFFLLWASCFSSIMRAENVIGRLAQSKAITRSEKCLV